MYYDSMTRDLGGDVSPLEILILTNTELRNWAKTHLKQFL